MRKGINLRDQVNGRFTLEATGQEKSDINLFRILTALVSPENFRRTSTITFTTIPIEENLISLGSLESMAQAPFNVLENPSKNPVASSTTLALYYSNVATPHIPRKHCRQNRKLTLCYRIEFHAFLTEAKLNFTRARRVEIQVSSKLRAWFGTYGVGFISLAKHKAQGHESTMKTKAVERSGHVL